MKCNLLQLVKLWPTGFAMLVLCALFSSPVYSMTVKEMRDKMPASRLTQAKAEFTRIEQLLGSVTEAQQQLEAVRQLIMTADQSYIKAKEQLGMIVKAMPVKNDSKVIQPEEEELANQADSDTQAVEAALTKLRNLIPEQAVAVVTDQPTGKGLSSLTIQQMKEKLIQITDDMKLDSATATVNQFERQWGRLPEAKSQIENTRVSIGQAKTDYNAAAVASQNASKSAASDETKLISKVDEALVNKAIAAAVALKTSLGRLKDFKPAEQPNELPGGVATVPHPGWSALDGYTELMIICIVLLLLVVALWLLDLFLNLFVLSILPYNKVFKPYNK